LQVFALGTRDGESNAAESGYFAARGLLAKSVAERPKLCVAAKWRDVPIAAVSNRSKGSRLFDDLIGSSE
jgi:hypothetical protein